VLTIHELRKRDPRYQKASYRLEAFANLYGPNNSKDLQIRTKVLRYEDKDWGVECDYRQAFGEGHNSIGDLLPGYFSECGLREVTVYQSDQATPLIPPEPHGGRCAQQV